MRGWLTKLEGSLSRGQLLHGVRRLLLAVSGGPDSMVLLRLFALRRRDVPAPSHDPELLVGHVHHGLRGAEAGEDEAFVRQTALELGIPFLLHRGDARLEARRWKLSPEAAARRLRYEAFARWALEEDLDAVALAHHRDDQAETVLLRVLRGTGLRGLAATPASRPLGPGTRARLIRPLLAWSRAEVLETLEDLGCRARKDSTNEDTSIPRNRVRSELLPALEARVHQGVREALARLAEQAGALRRDLEALGLRALGEARRPSSADRVALSVEALREWPGSVVREAIRQAIEGLGSGLEGSWGAEASREVLDWILGPAVKAEAHRDLSGNVWIDLRYGVLRLGLSLPHPPREAAGPDAVALSVPGTASWRGWSLSAGIVAAEGAQEPAGGPGGLVERLDADRVEASGPLQVRSRRPGDRIWPLGARGPKKLKELLRERRVPPDERGDVPIVAAGDAIVWVVGHRIADPFRVTDSTRRRLRLRASRPGEGSNTISAL